MDRSTQIITLLFMLCIGFTANAQQARKQKQKGIQAYPIYYLQGLVFEQDSSVIGLYDWVRPEDRMAVMELETEAVALVLDTMVSLPDMEITAIDEIDSLWIDDLNLIADSATIYEQMSLDSIYFLEDFYDFDASWDGSDSIEFVGQDDRIADSLSTEKVMLDSVQTDTLRSAELFIDSLGIDSELILVQDTLSDNSDSLQIETIIPDSLTQITSIITDSIDDDAPKLAIESLELDTISPDVPSRDSLSMAEDSSHLEVVLDTIDTDLIVDSLPTSVDPIEIDSVRIQSLDLDSIPSEFTTDSLPTVVEPIETDSLPSPIPLKIDAQPVDTTAIDLDKRQGEILIKSDPTLLGAGSISRPQLETSASRRSIMDRNRVETPVATQVAQSRVDTVVMVERIIEQAPAIVTERVVERPAEYMGQYAGLSKSERERQLRLDAESRRKADASDLEMKQEKHDAALDADERVREARAAQLEAETALANALASQAKEKSAEQESTTVTVSDTLPSVVQEATVKTSPAKVIMQRDTVTEKALAQLAARLEEQAAKTEQVRAIDNQKIDGRFDRIESKVDTLLNALGKKVVMNQAEYSIPKEEMNIYFAVNSHSVSARSLIDLENYISQLQNVSDYRIVLSGFADSSGDLEYNKLLVSKRIASVKDAILTMGVAPAELLVNNYGKQRANSAKTYNQLDRKVSIQIFSAE